MYGICVIVSGSAWRLAARGFAKWSATQLRLAVPRQCQAIACGQCIVL